jgi:ABC-type lipoprotein export system ATPase subunit
MLSLIFRKDKGMIELKNISKTYMHNSQSQVVLDNISHTFKEGSKTTILGESGCGKTTLLNLIGGIDIEFEGELLFKGVPVKDFDKFRRENVSFIFQDINLINHFNLIKNITMSLTNDVKNKEEKAIELLKHVGLSDHMDKKPHQLSGGERQRVAIARALARESDVLLCDEPTGSLDDETKIEIMNLIMKVFNDKTVIFVTHDEDIAANYSDVIFKFDDDGINYEIKHTLRIKTTPQNQSKANKTFNKRFEFNLLSKKLRVFYASYLIIIISALFLFGTGIIYGVDSEIDAFYIEKYKVNKIDVNSSYTIGGFSDYVDRYNSENDSQIIGFMTVLEMNTQFVSNDTTHIKNLRNIQPQLVAAIQEDLLVGRMPQENNEILYSKGSAIHSLFNYYTETIEDEDEQSKSYNKLFESSDQTILEELNTIETSYKNTYRFNPEWEYDNELVIVGLIDDYKYFNNTEVSFEYQNKTKKVVTNSNIYMLEEEYLEYIYNVYLGYIDKNFTQFSVFVEEENFDLRNDVFDGFLLHAFQISGKDYITNERNDYHDTLYGYKVALLAGCLILMIFGAISIYNGIRSNIERNKKNIGIYKSLGYTSKNIKTMFITEGLIISMVTILFSLFIWLVLKVLMNNAIVNVLDPSDKFNFGNITYLAPYSMIIVILVIAFINMTAINQEFKKINIVSLIKHK